MAKYIQGLGALAAMFDKAIIELPLSITQVCRESAAMVEEKVKKTYGDVSKLRELEQSTQDDRVAKGYSPNEPLLRDGKLLRDSIVTSFPTPFDAVIGSNEPIAAYHEYGFYNVRAGKYVRPRPVFRVVAAEIGPKLAAIAETEVAAVLRFETPRMRKVAGRNPYITDMGIYSYTPEDAGER